MIVLSDILYRFSFLSCFYGGIGRISILTFSLLRRLEFLCVEIKKFAISGTGYAYPDLRLNATFRVALGLAIAAVVFFADLYFIVKGMDDLGDKPIKVH